MIKGIDISEHNGNVDMTKIKNSGIEFVIVRSSWGHFTKDKQADNNVSKCNAIGMPYGLYHYSYATSEAEARTEAQEFLKLSKQYSGRSYPLVLDMEDADGYKKDRGIGFNQEIKFIKIFKEIIEDAGEYLMLYTNKDWYSHFIAIDKSLIDSLDLWLAHWGISAPSVSRAGIWQYSNVGKVTGSSANTDMNYAYKDYPTIIQNMKGNSMQKVITEAQKWLGTKQGDSNHKAIVDGYNSIKPLPLGYKVTYTDSWCDAFVSFVFKQVGLLSLVGGGECGVERHIQLFKSLGIWIEDGTITPQAGDIITYNWDQSTQPNDGYADHIGIVEKVSGTTITIIEGNIDYAVDRRTIQVGNGYIRGYARPKYVGATEPVQPTPTKKTNDQIALEVIGGKWGTGQTRIDRLKAGGYDPTTIQQLVNTKLGVTTKTNQQIADEVLAGKWGNGTDRKNKLTAAGYDYNVIQTIVNQTKSTTTHISKSGTWKFNTAVKIRSTPSTSSGDTGLIYTSGMTVNIASTQVADGYIWGKYTSTSGQTRYVALQKVNGIAYGKWV